MEVKGVTLEENGASLFPDAPTERGVKHLHGLIKSLDEGYLAYRTIQLTGYVASDIRLKNVESSSETESSSSSSSSSSSTGSTGGKVNPDTGR